MTEREDPTRTEPSVREQVARHLREHLESEDADYLLDTLDAEGLLRAEPDRLEWGCRGRGGTSLLPGSEAAARLFAQSYQGTLVVRNATYPRSAWRDTV